MVTVYVPAVLELTVRVEEPDPPGLKLMLAGLIEAVRPLGVTAIEKLIVPVKPATLLSVMDDAPELPPGTFTVVGLAEIVKSPTMTVMVAV
jgi:hypothetical protein